VPFLDPDAQHCRQDPQKWKKKVRAAETGVTVSTSRSTAALPQDSCRSMPPSPLPGSREVLENATRQWAIVSKRG